MEKKKELIISITAIGVLALAIVGVSFAHSTIVEREKRLIRSPQVC